MKLGDFAFIPVRGTGGERFRAANARAGACETCGAELVGFTFARHTGYLCLECDREHALELAELGAQHCATCTHTEMEHLDPRFAPRCGVLSCPCAEYKR